MLPCYSPWKYQKTYGFPLFSGSIKWEHYPEVGWTCAWLPETIFQHPICERTTFFEFLAGAWINFNGLIKFGICLLAHFQISQVKNLYVFIFHRSRDMVVSINEMDWLSPSILKTENFAICVFDLKKILVSNVWIILLNLEEFHF